MLKNHDIEKIERINGDFAFVHESFTSQDSKAYEGYLKTMAGAMKDGALPGIYKELIAIGIASFHNCEPCIVWHIREALKNGANKAQIAEAIDVAIEMGGGPVVARSGFSFKVLEYFTTARK